KKGRGEGGWENVLLAFVQEHTRTQDPPRRAEQARFRVPLGEA
ncbi:hypothetical protein LCGC14_1744050, partial [marine sediment metagenome]